MQVTPEVARLMVNVKSDEISLHIPQSAIAKKRQIISTPAYGPRSRFGLAHGEII